MDPEYVCPRCCGKDVVYRSSIYDDRMFPSDVVSSPLFDKHHAAIQDRLDDLVIMVRRWSRHMRYDSIDKQHRQTAVMIVINRCAIILMDLILTMTENPLRPILSSVIIGWLLHFQAVLVNERHLLHERSVFEPCFMLYQLLGAFLKVYEHMDRFCAFRLSYRRGAPFTPYDMVHAIYFYLTQGRMTDNARRNAPEYTDCIIPKYSKAHAYLYAYMTSQCPEDRELQCNAATTLIYSILKYSISDLVEGIGTQSTCTHITPVIIDKNTYDSIEATLFNQKSRMAYKDVLPSMIKSAKTKVSRILYFQKHMFYSSELIVSLYKHREYDAYIEVHYKLQTVGRQLLEKYTIDYTTGEFSLQFMKDLDRSICKTIYTDLLHLVGTPIHDTQNNMFSFASEPVSPFTHEHMKYCQIPIFSYIQRVTTPAAQTISEVTESILSNFYIPITDYYENCVYIEIMDESNAYTGQLDVDILQLNARPMGTNRWFVPCGSYNRYLHVTAYIINIQREQGSQCGYSIRSYSTGWKTPTTIDDPNEWESLFGLYGQQQRVEGRIDTVFVMDAIIGDWIDGSTILQNVESHEARNVIGEFKRFSGYNNYVENIVSYAHETIKGCRLFQSFYPAQKRKRDSRGGKTDSQ